MPSAVGSGIRHLLVHPIALYLDTGNRRNFANGGGPTQMFPDFSARLWEAYGGARLVVTGPELDAARALVNSLAAATAHNAAVAKHAA